MKAHAGTDREGWRFGLRRWDRFLLAITACGLLLRVATIASQSFWDDELFTTWLLDMDFSGMFREMANTEATPPLYYAVGWLWTRVAGDSEVGLRSLSALAGTAAIPIGYLSARELLSRRGALWAAALIATNPFLVWYSQEARSYALLVPLSGLVLLFFLRALPAPESRPLLGWGCASGAALLTHYFAIFLIGPTAIWLLVRHRQRPRRVVLAVLIPSVTALGLLPLVHHQRTTVSDPGAIGTSSFVTRLVALPKNFLVGYALPAELVLTAMAAALVAVAVGVAVTQRAPRRQWLIPGSVAALAVAIPLAGAVAGVDYLTSRNALPALVPALLVVAAGAARSRVTAVIGAGICAISLVVVGSVAVDPIYGRKDWRGAAEAAGAATVDRVVVFAPSFINAGPFRTYFETGTVVSTGTVRAREITVVALALEGAYGTGVPRPPRDDAAAPPPGFELDERIDAATFTLVRYRAPREKEVAVDQLRDLMLGNHVAAVVVQRPKDAATER